MLFITNGSAVHVPMIIRVNWAIPEVGSTRPKEDMGLSQRKRGNSKKIWTFLV